MLGLASRRNTRTRMTRITAPLLSNAQRRCRWAQRFFVDTVRLAEPDDRRADFVTGLAEALRRRRACPAEALRRRVALINRWAPRMRSRTESGETHDSRTSTHG